MLVSEAFGGSGGIAQFNRDFLSALARDARVASIDVLPRLISSTVATALTAGVICDARAAQGPFAFVGAVVARLWRRERIDVVLCGHIHLLPAAWLLARLRGARLVLIVHGYEAWTPPLRVAARLLAPRVDALIAVSRLTAERFCGWTGFSLADSFVLPNCVDLDRFQPAPRDEALAARYGLGSGLVLMTLGRMAAHERYKGFDTIIDLMPRLAERIPGLRYLVVGDGDDRARLAAKAHALGLGDRVVFTGAVAESDKPAHYRLADVFVLPSTGEGFGIVLIEAAACGLAIVGSSRDGSREALRDGALGQLVDPDDNTALLDAITVALMTKGHPARQADVEKFSVDNFRRRVALWLDAMVPHHDAA